MELDATLTSRDIINKRMREVIEDASIGWGVDVTRVELQSIEPPRDIQQSIELQLRAERELRAAVTILGSVPQFEAVRRHHRRLGAGEDSRENQEYQERSEQR